MERDVFGELIYATREGGSNTQEIHIDVNKAKTFIFQALRRIGKQAHMVLHVASVSQKRLRLK